jgi:hypothetical protein
MWSLGDSNLEAPRTQDISNQKSHYRMRFAKKPGFFTKCDLVVEKIVDAERNAFTENDNGVNSRKALK